MSTFREFDDILNECLERTLHGEPVEQCLASFPEYADRLKPLLETGLQVRKAASVQPRPEFRTAARAQFRAALYAAEKSKPSFFGWLRQPQWAALSATALLIILVTGTAVLSNGSLPDQPLYPVKLITEKIQIALTPSPEAKGDLYARLLERRLNEITAMAQQNNPGKIQAAATQLASLSTVITASTAERSEDKTAAVPQSTPALTPPQSALAPQFAAPATTPTAPTGVSPNQDIAATPPSLAGAATITGTGNATATANTAPGIPSPAAPSVAIPPQLVDAAANIAKLRDLLASAPESERPALENALNAAEQTYTALAAYLGNN
jgi:hypothetical protein